MNGHPNPFVQEYLKAIREAIGHLEPGPAECLTCDGCRADHYEALRILRDAAELPMAFFVGSDGNWQKMRRVQGNGDTFYSTARPEG